MEVENITFEPIPLHSALEIIFETFNTFSSEKSPIYWLKGAPGIGKTSLILEYCKKNNFIFRHINLGTIPLEMSSGLPYDKKTENGITVEWSIPSLIDFSNMPDIKQDTKIVYFIDDIHLAEINVQKIFFELFTNKSLQGHKLRNNIYFILASNNNESSGYKKILAPVINRTIMLTINMNFEYWLTNFGIKNLPEEIISFLSTYRSSIEEPESNTEPFGTYRSWSEFGKVFQILKKTNNITEENLIKYASGITSKTNATDFANHYFVYSKYNTKEFLLENQKPNINIEDSEIITLTFSIAIAYRICELIKNNKLNIVKAYEKIEEYIKLIKNQMSATITLITTIKSIEPDIINQLIDICYTNPYFSNDSLLKKTMMEITETFSNSN